MSARAIVVSVLDWLRRRPDSPAAPIGLRATRSLPLRPSVPAPYLPLYRYLDQRYAVRVVLTFDEIEALLGFTPPAPAFTDVRWWTDPMGPTGRHAAAWATAQRTALPQMRARIVTFERTA